MVDALFLALLNLMSLTHLGFMVIGICVGLVVGVLPGLGGIVGMSILLPFIYGMDMTSALAMLIGMVPTIAASDTFTSVLMGIPGSSASQATVLDGFPLSKKGEAARALSAAFSSSLIGGLFGAVVLTAFVVIARPVILSFGSAELFMLAIFGLSMVGALSGSSLAKGITACAVGLTVGAIGSAPATAEYRMDFDAIYLMDGIPLVIVGLGIFALPEIVDLLRSNAAIASESRLGHGWLRGLKDTWRNLGLTLRCSGIGAMVGAIPGLGGSVVDWIAYGHVVQTAKDKSQFGKGDIRGVIAPESAANAKEGGALIPTLLFSIPGSGSMAVFLAGLVLLGLQPGPAMAGRNLDVTYTIVWSLAIANVLGTALCILVAPGIARLTTIRYPLIAPFMIMVICFASFQATRSFYDLLALLGVGVLGIFFKRFGWSRPAFLVGFVLSVMSERYLYQAVQFDGWGFITKPLVLAILVITIVSVWYGTRNRPLDTDERAKAGGGVEIAPAGAMIPQAIFTLVLLGLFVFAFYEGWQLSFLGGVFPMAIAAVGAIGALFVVVPQLTGRTESNVNFDLESVGRAEDDPGPWYYLAWIVGFIAIVALIGFFAALLGFFVVFLRVIARASWPLTLALTASCAIVLLVLADALTLNFPGGVLQAYFDLPWPFR